eukprot:GFKZ01000348.1.p1 GENE.GFKZ01000348.1~~GFKZ01000348.1.p1  ORF type:complete len:130 (-),score=15.32 GFKZ01000348.1:812-1201(-)
MTEHKYVIGEPVWAFLEGFPWWPARVVDGDDIFFEAEEKPDIDDGSHVVQFFGDRTCAVLPCEMLRPLAEYIKFKEMLLVAEKNQPCFHDLQMAIARAERYMQKVWPDLQRQSGAASGDRRGGLRGSAS